jgi:hypothetical protein
MYKILLDCLPELDRPPYSLRILALIAVISRARPLANAYSAVRLPPLQHASLRHRLASIVYKNSLDCLYKILLDCLPELDRPPSTHY